MHCLGQNENWLLLILNGGRGGLIWDACVRFVHAVQHDRIVRSVIAGHLASDWGGGGKCLFKLTIIGNYPKLSTEFWMFAKSSFLLIKE